MTDKNAGWNDDNERMIVIVQKIMLWSEEKALEYYELPAESRPGPPSTYYNAKKLNREDALKKEDELAHRIELLYDYHFGTTVNTSFSSIHVPTSIYEKSLSQATLHCDAFIPSRQGLVNYFDCFCRGGPFAVDRLVIQYGQHVHLKLPDKSHPLLAVLWVLIRVPSTVPWFAHHPI
jgi:hypothetical protein